MKDVIVEAVIIALLVLVPLIGMKKRRDRLDYRKQSRLRSNYCVNEDGELELMKKEGEEQE